MWAWIALGTGLIGQWVAGKSYWGWVICALASIAWVLFGLTLNNITTQVAPEVIASGLAIVIAARNVYIGRRLKRKSS